MSFWDGRKVAVTGGAGFIGSHLVEYLVWDGADVTVVDNLERGRLENLAEVIDDVRFVKGDLQDKTVCETAFADLDMVLNLAAKVTSISYNSEHQADMFTQNMMVQCTPIKAAYEVGVPRFVQCSTACVYPHDAPVPTPEEWGHRGEPEPTNAGYGWAKRMGEKQAMWFAEETDMEIVIVRPFNAYGPRDYYDEETSHVAPALIKKVLDGDDPVEVWGSGDQTRALVHAKDFAKGIQLCAENAEDARPINIGHDEEISIRKLLQTILKLAGAEDREIFYNTDMPEGYPRRAADTSRLKEVTGGFVPSISLEEGLTEMIEWYQAHGGESNC